MDKIGQETKCKDCKNVFEINKTNFYYDSVNNRFKLTRCKPCHGKLQRENYHKNKNKEKKEMKQPKIFVCKHCRTEKEVNHKNFYYNKIHKKFMLSRCSECSRIYRKNYYRKHKKEVIKKNNIYLKTYRKQRKYKNKANQTKKEKRIINKMKKLHKNKFLLIEQELFDNHKKIF